MTYVFTVRPRSVTGTCRGGHASRRPHLVSRLPRYLADLAIAAAIFPVGFVVNDLEHGLGDLPRHWRSRPSLIRRAADGSPSS